MKRSIPFKRLLIIFSLLLLLALAAGCGGPQEEPITPEEVLANSLAAMNAFDGYHFLIVTEGKEIYLDQDGTIVLKQAEGDFVSPDRVAADIKVMLSTIVAQVSIINIGDSKWETNPIFGTWQESTADYAFRPLELLDPEAGILAVIARDASNLTMETDASLEELPGVALIKLTGDVDGAGLNALSYGLIDAETLGLEIWVTPDSYELDRLVITDPVNPGDEAGATWSLDFWNFGETPTIEPPL